MTNLTEQHERLAADSKWDFSDLSALFINCTLKRSPEVVEHARSRGSRGRDHGAQRRLGRGRSERSTIRSRPVCTRT